ncbi:hypothetical protein [Phaeacidiphilus oryzae]|uniref:hypothetical protein n=1 Tax=Phaeacidiphilus oryzae TaxID=348818 RepID=UPI000566D368|nr:hypothetical protein [Phaeacidiphilus oryzae]
MTDLGRLVTQLRQAAGMTQANSPTAPGTPSPPPLPHREREDLLPPTAERITPGRPLTLTVGDTTRA